MFNRVILNWSSQVQNLSNCLSTLEVHGEWDQMVRRFIFMFGHLNNENVLNNIKIAKKRFIILPNTKMVKHFGQSNNSTYLIIIYNFLVILTRDGT